MQKHRKPKSQPTDADYVSNTDLYAALIEYRAKRLAAEAAGKKKPKVSPYIGECMMRIAMRLSYRWNFINYPYREEMVSDGIVTCMTYLDNFDPTKSKSPFCYFTQVCWFAFQRIINKEKKEKHTQYMYAESQNNKDFHHWFNETYAGVEIGRREFFGLTDTDMDRFSEEGLKKKAKGSKVKPKKPKKIDLDNPLGL